MMLASSYSVFVYSPSLRSLFVHVTLRCCLFHFTLRAHEHFLQDRFFDHEHLQLFYLTWDILHSWLKYIDVHLPHSWGSVPSDTGFPGWHRFYLRLWLCLSAPCLWLPEFLVRSLLVILLRTLVGDAAVVSGRCQYSAFAGLCKFDYRVFGVGLLVQLMWSSCTSFWIFIFTYLRLHCLVFTFGKFQPLFLHSSGPLSLSSGTRAVRVCVRARWWSHGSFRLITFLQSCLSAPSVSIIFIVLFQVLVFFLHLPFGLFSETVSVDLCFPLNGPYFLFLYVPVCFFCCCWTADIWI